MSEDDPQITTENLEPVQVILEIPGRLLRNYRLLAEAGLYLSTEEALRHALICGWRFEMGAHHSVRLDLSRDGDVMADDEATEHASDENA